MELVTQLFASWDKDAVVMDRERGIYADHTKVRPINVKGKYFSCRGPLNTVPSPQGKPVFLQAGGSPRGRGFAARVADSIIAVANGTDGMKAYRDDVRARAEAAGRDPDEIKVMFLVYPVIGVTQAEAEAKHERMVTAPGFIEAGLAMTGTVTDIDFSQYDLDQPLPGKLTTNGEQGSLDKFQQWGSGKTLRQLASERYDGGLRLVGTPDQVARLMGEAMEEVGGDGFLISTPFQLSSRQRILEITEGLVPALQRQGLVRSTYRGTTLREVLREF